MASLVNIFVTIFGGFIFLMRVQSRVAIQAILIKNLSDAVTRMDKTIEDLRRGDGWIQTPHRHTLDREYP